MVYIFNNYIVSMLNFLNLTIALWVYEGSRGMITETNSKKVARETDTAKGRVRKSK